MIHYPMDTVSGMLTGGCRELHATVAPRQLLGAVARIQSSSARRRLRLHYDYDKLPTGKPPLAPTDALSGDMGRLAVCVCAHAHAIMTTAT